MKRPLLLACVALGLVPLAGCADHYVGRASVGWHTYPYYGWYDGFYGPFYDGYWGSDGYFWFRLTGEEQRYRRDERHHFRRENQGDDPRYQRFDRTMQQPPEGTRMPRYPRQERDRH